MAKIVVVEDEDHLREDLVEELIDCGHEVIPRRNGEEGLRAIIEHRPDLIISDCLMPVMSGEEMLIALRTDHPEFDSVPFVFLSAHASPGQIEGGLERGATKYLTKPVDYDDLHSALDDLLQLRSKVPQPL